MLRPGEQANCPRCHHALTRRHRHPVQRSMALAGAALVCLLVAMYFPFVSVNLAGQDQHLQLMGTVTSMAQAQQPLVALIVGLVIIGLPALYLLGVIFMQLEWPWTFSIQLKIVMARYFASIHPWMMADVFVVAVLVSLVKLLGMVDIVIGPAFWAYSVFAVLLLMTTRSIDIDWLWRRLTAEPTPPAALRAGMTAAAQGMVACMCCGNLQATPTQAVDAPRLTHACVRCGSAIQSRTHLSQQASWALLCAAAILYIPANVYPMMVTTAFGQTQTNTLMAGMILLWQQGSQPIAVIIFIASMVVPVAKMLALALLNWAVNHPTEAVFSRITLYRLTQFVGRWSMVDVFVVAILVALIQAGNLMSVLPGPAALAFCAMVIFNIFAAHCFDPRQLWPSTAIHESP